MKGCNAVMYLRLSKEETGGGILNESNSISNQREMIRHFLEKHPEITLVNEFSDDGKSGVDFNRPGFLRMMEGLKKGEADCVIVKDLSRFGRNYIDAGIYLERVFPWMGIRFIAVSDGYDSEHAKAGDDLLLPFKNLMNDAYARDASLKVRSTLAAKSAGVMPQPSSLMRIISLPPPSMSTRIWRAPASTAFSSSSFSTPAGRSITSPAAIWPAVFSSST